MSSFNLVILRIKNSLLLSMIKTIERLKLYISAIIDIDMKTLLNIMTQKEGNNTSIDIEQEKNSFGNIIIQIYSNLLTGADI